MVLLVIGYGQVPIVANGGMTLFSFFDGGQRGIRCMKELSVDKDRVPDIGSTSAFYEQRVYSLTVDEDINFWPLVTAKKAPKSRRHDSVPSIWSRWIKLSADGNGDTTEQDHFLTDTAEFKIPRTT